MIEDKLLVFRFKQGSRTALQQIYTKYHGYLLTLATALLKDEIRAEDVVHDFFVGFAQSADRVKLRGSLKWYLAVCVANRAKDALRADRRQLECLENKGLPSPGRVEPESSVQRNEAMERVSAALNRIPYEQREVVVLHTRGGMTFTSIARHQKVSIKTSLSRYRYGLDKLRTLLNDEVRS